MQVLVILFLCGIEMFISDTFSLIFANIWYHGRYYGPEFLFRDLFHHEISGWWNWWWWWWWWPILLSSDALVNYINSNTAVLE